MRTRKPQTIFFTRADVTEYATKLFPQEDITLLLSILDQYGSQGHEQERERVHMAILYLSNGSIDGLDYHVQRAKQDYRDVLYWAEYNAHDKHRLPYEW
jgi:hypothetical protein